MKRVIKTFEPDADVAAMLRKAEKTGIKLTFLCNESLRRYLRASGYGPCKETLGAVVTGPHKA